MATGRKARRASLGLRILLSLLLGGIPLTVWGGEVGTQRLQKWFWELDELSQRAPFGVPLRMQSEERNDQMIAEVHAIIEHPFDTVKAALGSPATWCDIVPLSVTVKACTYQAQGHETLVTLFLCG